MPTESSAINHVDLDSIITLRRNLHQLAELSGQEFQTAAHIAEFMQQYNPDKVLTGLGGAGIAVVFYGKQVHGPTILFRAELDALPIAETNTVPYASHQPGIGHKCGHDGHMAILAALGAMLQQSRPKKGKVILLFQPAEETGEGAWALLQDERFLALAPDYVFALHNMPGKELNQVIVREGSFAAASSGAIVELQGKSSHAAEPENGVNPGLAMSKLILTLNGLVEQTNHFHDLTLLTVIHARLGEVAFGTNPGFATVMATLRAFEQADLNKLKRLTQSAAASVAEEFGIRYNIRFVEEFPATVNHAEAVKAVTRSAINCKLDLQHAVHPVRWSEDFGHFTNRYKGALFGLGAGINHPQLHHSDYDFPDTLIRTGASLFFGLVQQYLNT